MIRVLLPALVAIWGCRQPEPPVTDSRPLRPACSGEQPPTAFDAGTPEQEAEFTRKRTQMVKRQLAGRDITDARVLKAMGTVPRHRFVRPGNRAVAYSDRPLPFACQQTVSQPYIVALMTQLARPKKKDRVLDVGTGSGYQAAVLAELSDRVDSIEILCELADNARARLNALGHDNVTVHCGDGFAGLPNRAPFDVIIVAAAPEKVPPKLLEQLAPGGRLVIPVGGRNQELLLVEKDIDGRITKKTVTSVRFVPMTR